MIDQDDRCNDHDDDPDDVTRMIDQDDDQDDSPGRLTRMTSMIILMTRTMTRVIAVMTMMMISIMWMIIPITE